MEILSETKDTDSSSKSEKKSLKLNPESKTSQASSSGKTESNGKKNSAQIIKDETFEPCVLGKSKLWIPQELKNKTLFHDIISMNTWEEVLTSEEKSALTKLLPSFTDNNEEEQKEALRQLFDGDNFQFGNPLQQFERDLSQGRYRPESVEKQRAWDRLQREECRQQNTHRLQTMLPDVLIKRQELLEVVQFTSPSEYIKKNQQKIKPSKVNNQGKEKYEKLLEELSLELGESLLSDEEAENGVYSDEEDVSQLPWEDRLGKLFDSPMKRTHCTTTPKTPTSEGNGPVKVKPPLDPGIRVVTEKDYKKMLERMQIVKEDGIDHPEFIVSHITLRDIIGRTYPVRARSQEEVNALKRKRKKEKEEIKSKKKKKAPIPSPKPSTPVSMISSQDSLHRMDPPSSPESSTPAQPEPLPATTVKKEEMPSIIQGSTEVPNKMQYQVPHSFFALLRKYFNMAMNHQLWVSDLQEKVSIWEKSPVSILCPWRPLQLTWSKVVENTLYFLSLEEQGRLISYVEEEDSWIWPDPMSIPNDHLTMLFKRWLDLMLRVQPVVSPMSKEGTLVIPEPRMYTDYTIRSPSEGEVLQFREQELQRFSEPHKPFTYYQHGYESVVGPVKGITPLDPLPASRGREHSLLISDRPSYVTILSLVRDAVARLPNGEGTKIEICHLLKESQYIFPNAEANILAAVSGALDRLHNEKDPSVKFDAARKLWVYLHRNRTVKDFERIQLEQMLTGRPKKTKSKQGSQIRVPLPDFTSELTPSSSESSSPSLETSNRSSPGGSRSISPRVAPQLHSPRSMTQCEIIDSKAPVMLTAFNTTSSPVLQKSFGGNVTLDPHGTGHQDFDPSISTIQSLISESLIQTQLMKKPFQRSKTPPASLGRSNTTPPSKKPQFLTPIGVQRSMSIPASWPHVVQSAAGDLIPSNIFLAKDPVKPLAAPVKTQENTKPEPSVKKPSDSGSKGRPNSPRASGSKSSSSGKSKSKGDKSKSSKSSGSEKKSPTVQLKSGAITVTLPSSALKGQTVRSILASAASITIGKTAQGEEQGHPTVQAVRKRLMAEKTQNSSKAKQLKQTQVKVTEGHEQVRPTIPPNVEPKRANLPTIILRPTAQAFIGQTAPVSKDGLVSHAQLSAQPLALVGSKPAGLITGVTTSQIPTSKQLPLSLVVSGTSSTVTPIQQGGIPIPSLAPGQNIILQMPDGSKFVTSIPASTATPTMSVKKQTLTKMAKPVPVIGTSQPTMGVLQPGRVSTIITSPQKKQASPHQGRSISNTTFPQNPYDFDDEQEVPKPPPQMGKLPTAEKRTPIQTNQMVAVSSNTNTVQRFALNLVKKQGGIVRKQTTQGSHSICVAPTLTHTGLIRGTLAQTRPLKGTLIQTGPIRTTAIQSGISVGAISQAQTVQGVTVSQPGVIKGMVSQRGLLTGTITQSTATLVPNTTVGPLKMSQGQTGKIVRNMVAQDGQSAASVVFGETIKDQTGAGHWGGPVISAPSVVLKKSSAGKVLPFIPQLTTRRGPTQTNPTGSLIGQRIAASVPVIRMANRPHSAPGILRKNQESVRRLGLTRQPLRVARPTSDVIRVPQGGKTKADYGGGDTPQESPQNLIRGQEQSVLVRQQKPVLMRQEKTHSEGEGGGSFAGPTGDHKERMGVLEGTVNTAKLIKSQELAGAVLGDMTKQGGQEQT